MRASRRSARTARAVRRSRPCDRPGVERPVRPGRPPHRSARRAGAVGHGLSTTWPSTTPPGPSLGPRRLCACEPHPESSKVWGGRLRWRWCGCRRWSGAAAGGGAAGSGAAGVSGSAGAVPAARPRRCASAAARRRARSRSRRRRPAELAREALRQFDSRVLRELRQAGHRSSAGRGRPGRSSPPLRPTPKRHAGRKKHGPEGKRRQRRRHVRVMGNAPGGCLVGNRHRSTRFGRRARADQEARVLADPLRLLDEHLEAMPARSLRSNRWKRTSRVALVVATEPTGQPLPTQRTRICAPRGARTDST